MKPLPLWTWQVMHWLEGMDLVNLCSTGWPFSPFLMFGSGLSGAVSPAFPYFAHGPEL